MSAAPVWHEGEVTVADRWTYRYDHRRHPHIHPLRTPAGHVLTIDGPDDHPWHHALWFAVKFVNGDNFWEEMAPYGVQRHLDDPPVVAAAPSGEGGGVTIAGWLDWIAPDRTTVVLRERRLLTHVPIDETSYAIDISVELHPNADLELDRTPWSGEWGGYSGLTFRGRRDFVDTRILLADGSEHDRVLGVPSPALDLSGTIDGSSAGVAILDAATNAEHPVPWYASTKSANYGTDGWSNFVNAAFLWHGPRSLPHDQVLKRDHRVIVHDGAWGPDDLTAALAAYRLVP